MVRDWLRGGVGPFGSMCVGLFLLPSIGVGPGLCDVGWIRRDLCDPADLYGVRGVAA